MGSLGNKRKEKRRMDFVKKDVKIKILIVGMNGEPGGGMEKITFDYISRIKNREIEFSFSNIHDRIRFQNELENIGCKIFSLPSPKKKPALFIREYLKLCKNEKFDIIHINMLSAANILPLLCAKLSACKNIIVHSHNGNTVGIHRHILHFTNKFFVKLFANHYFACSNAAAKFMFGTTKNVKIIKNAIDVSKYKFDEENGKKFREKLNLPQNSLLIGHVGRFDKQKNHSFLIRVFKEIQEKNSKVFLILVGVGYAMEDTKKLAKDLKIIDRVIFYGKSDDTAQIYSAMDLFLLPSLFEGLPLVGIEAQCSGLSILTSNGISKEMGITDLVRWLDLNDGEQKWADIASELLSNPRIRIRNAYAKEIENAGYSIEKEAEKLENLYLGFFVK
jgi:glycosyltransferase involved in cell wall biosynthesis